ncbi:MAG TPA: carboxypeptidase-like regulatory domain-containing protein [Bryobacteraceae bacterium]|nr:carboxypeptidase-like regulatory domain-containing protein [Bryobacteraceae bacterium]
MRFLLSSILSLAAFAAGYHKISGVVTDQTGAPIPEATIEIRAGEISGGVDQVTRLQSDTSGTFASTPLPPGTYRLSVTRSGFATQRLAVSLSDKDSALRIVLPLATQAYSVTVEGRASSLDTSTAAHQDAFVLDQQMLAELPVKDGDILTALGSFVNPAGGAAPTVIVDGMERTDAELPLSSIQQVRVNNNAYSAEFPKPGKDRIEIDTKGGDDSFHGGFIVRARNSIFDARNPMADTKPPFSRYGYEGNLSGPVLRKRLWFFLDANTELQQQSQAVFAYLPFGILQSDVLSPVTRYSFLGRLDWQATKAQRIGIKYELHIDKTQNGGIGGFSLPDLATSFYHHDYRIEISDQFVLSPELLNSFRIALGTNTTRVSSANDQPLVIVQGAFSSGGAQVNEWRKEPRTDMQDTLSFAQSKSEWKFGVTANLHPFHTYNADNFGGTYTFASLAAYEAGEPEQFTITTGNPLLSFQQHDYAWFAQYERKIGSASLFAGVRDEFQSGLSRNLNLAPRLAAAFAPGKDHRTVIRIGGGVFYDRRPPPVLEQSLRYDGIQTQQYVVTDPAYPASQVITTGAPAQVSLWRIDPNMTLPRVYQASATVERQLPFGFVLVSDYTYQRGTHLLRARDINAPVASTGLRPNPDEGNIDQIESSASSRGNILNWTLKSPPMRRFQFFAQYTLSRLYDDTGAAFPPPPGVMASAAGLFAALLPANSYDLRPEWGRANNDARNRFGLSGTIQLPWKLVLGTMTVIRSGLPFDITTGQVNPEGVANVRPPGVARNTGEGPGQASVDVHLGRKIPLHFGERQIDAELGLDSFNVLNHTNLDNYIGVITSPLFGEANAASDGRQMQFTLQAHF